jgi:hypothetical protein
MSIIGICHFSSGKSEGRVLRLWLGKDRAIANTFLARTRDRLAC